VEGGELEHLEGSALIRFGASFRQLWAGPIAFSRRIGTQFRISAGAQPVAIEEAAAHSDLIVVGMRLSVDRPRRP